MQQKEASLASQSVFRVCMLMPYVEFIPFTLTEVNQDFILAITRGIPRKLNKTANNIMSYSSRTVPQKWFEQPFHSQHSQFELSQNNYRTQLLHWMKTEKNLNRIPRCHACTA